MIDVTMVFRSFSLPLNCIACQSDNCLLRRTINPASHSLHSSPHWRIYNCDEAGFWLTGWGQRGKPNNVTSFMSGAYWRKRHDSLEETSALSVKCERKLGCVCLYCGAASVVGGVRMRLKLCLHMGKACLNKTPHPCFTLCKGMSGCSFSKEKCVRASDQPVFAPSFLALHANFVCFKTGLLACLLCSVFICKVFCCHALTLSHEMPQD